MAYQFVGDIYIAIWLKKQAEFIAWYKRSEYEAASLYGIDPDMWDNWDERARTAIKPLSPKESAIYGHILWKASEIRAGERVYR